MPQKINRKIGLSRALSKLGYCSRSHAAELIRAGRVSVGGKISRNPETPLHGRVQIEVDGKAVGASRKLYIMLNKPRGVVTTASDEKGRETVYTILDKHSAVEGNLRKQARPWLAPVGRLDKASEGLLLLTNDSEWGARVAAPETHLNKSYHVQIGTLPDEEFVQALLRGVKAKDGVALRSKHVKLLRAGEKYCWLEIVLDEGKNRQIRRMMEAMGVEVLRLVRVAIGPLKLGDLAKGEHRHLSEEERRMLDRAMQGRMHERD